MSEVTSQDAGINADVLDVDTPVADNGADTASKKKTGVPKLLADKNAAIAQVESLQAEFDAYKANSVSKDNLGETLDLMKETNDVMSYIGEDKLEAYNSMKESNPNLRPWQIATLLGIQMDTSQPNKLSISWNTPASFKKKQTMADKSTDELRIGAEDELRAMLGH